MKITLTIFIICLLLISINAQTPNQNQPLSLRITNLEKEIVSGNKEALSDFWKEVKLKGTPLIEPIDDKEKSLVTFLWRGNKKTENVLVMSPFFPWMMVRRQMTLLPNTDVWYKSVIVPNDARFTYQFTENDPRLAFADPQDWNKFKVPATNDELNPNKFYFPKNEDIPNDAASEYSLLEMPSAYNEPMNSEKVSVKKGNVETHTLKSDVLENERQIWVYTPPNYSAAKKYPLLILLDGWDYLNLIPTPTILDNLQANKKIPPVVAVFVSSPIKPGSRENEFQGNQKFMDFTVKELLPWIHSKYNVTSNPKNTTIGGLSFGGLAAGFVGLKHSDKFGNVLMQSPSLWWGPEDYDKVGEWLNQQYVKEKKLPLRFYIEIGKFEVFPSTRVGRPIPLHAVRHFRDILRIKGNDISYHEFNGTHDYINWRETLANGLTFLLGKQKK